jgi:hypothetical protein
VYERRHEPLVSRRVFLGRLAQHAVWAAVVVLAALGLGMVGYHWLEGMAWTDAYLNAAMILGGMGPVAELRTTAGKLFAGTYALFAGIVFLLGVGVVLAPVVHRALHHFHLSEKA